MFASYLWTRSAKVGCNRSPEYKGRIIQYLCFVRQSEVASVTSTVECGLSMVSSLYVGALL